MSLEAVLREVFLFRVLDDVGIAAIAALARFVQIDRGEHLFEEGDGATALYAVVEGRVKIVRANAAGGEVLVHVQSVGDLIAEAAIFSLKRYPASCVAMEPSLLVRIPAAEFTALLRRHPDIALAVMHGYSLRLRSFVETIGILSSHDVRVRLARWLVAELRSAHGRGGPGDTLPPATTTPAVTLRITRRDMAAQLGTVPETLSRAFSALRRAGVITTQGDRVEIADIRALRRIAEE